MIEAVIFDVDGTLVDSNDLHIAAWREAFRRYGRELTYEAVHTQIGKGGDQLMPVFLSEDELDRFGQALEAFRVRLFTEKYLPRAKPFPRVRELFERIRGDGLRIALATSSRESEIRQHIETLGVGDLLDACVSKDDVERSKPCPDVFQAALERLHTVAASSAMVVGDTPYDVIAARKARMQTIALLSGGFAEEALRAAGAVAVFRSIADLLQRYALSPLCRRRSATI